MLVLGTWNSFVASSCHLTGNKDEVWVVISHGIRNSVIYVMSQIEFEHSYVAINI